MVQNEHAINRTPVDFEDAKRLISELKAEIIRRPKVLAISYDADIKTEFSVGEFPKLVSHGQTYQIEIETDDGYGWTFKSVVNTKEPNVFLTRESTTDGIVPTLNQSGEL